MAAQIEALALNMLEQGFLVRLPRARGVDHVPLLPLSRSHRRRQLSSGRRGGGFPAHLRRGSVQRDTSAALAGAAAGMVTALIHTKLRDQQYHLRHRRDDGALLGEPAGHGPGEYPAAANAHRIRRRRPAFNHFGFALRDNVYTTILSPSFFSSPARPSWCGSSRPILVLRCARPAQNEPMILSLGVDTDRTKIVGLALSNAFIALSGALVAQNHGFSDIGMGIGILVWVRRRS